MAPYREYIIAGVSVLTVLDLGCMHRLIRFSCRLIVSRFGFMIWDSDCRLTIAALIETERLIDSAKYDFERIAGPFYDSDYAIERNIRHIEAFLSTILSYSKQYTTQATATTLPAIMEQLWSTHAELSCYLGLTPELATLVVTYAYGDVEFERIAQVMVDFSYYFNQKTQM